jgi:hypothetical protein
MPMSLLTQTDVARFQLGSQDSVGSLDGQGAIDGGVESRTARRGGNWRIRHMGSSGAMHTCCRLEVPGKPPAGLVGPLVNGAGDSGQAKRTDTVCRCPACW